MQQEQDDGIDCQYQGINSRPKHRVLNELDIMLITEIIINYYQLTLSMSLLHYDLVLSCQITSRKV